MHPCDHAILAVASCLKNHSSGYASVSAATKWVWLNLSGMPKTVFCGPFPPQPLLYRFWRNSPKMLLRHSFTVTRFKKFDDCFVHPYLIRFRMNCIAMTMTKYHPLPHNGLISSTALFSLKLLQVCQKNRSYRTVLLYSPIHRFKQLSSPGIYRHWIDSEVRSVMTSSTIQSVVHD